MDDSLIGKFAQSKLDSIIKFHDDFEKGHREKEDYEKVKNEFNLIQQSIGDEYISNVIQNHIDEIEKKVYGKGYNHNEVKKLLGKMDKEEIKIILGELDD